MKTDTLRGEVDQILDMINQTKRKLNDEKLRHQTLQDKKNKNHDRLKRLSDLDSLQLDALRAEKKWTMTKQISLWDLSEVNQQQTTLAYVGPCLESCASVTFYINSSGDLVSESDISSSLYNWRGSMYPATVAKYCLAQNAALCSAMAFSGKQKTSVMKRILRSNAWTRCRLEAICSELRVLHRRYNASIETKTSKNEDKSFVVYVRLSRFGSHVELLASFELTSAYPFGSLNTQVKQLDAKINPRKGDIDLERLNEVLAKNARPGFGYLSRTIAVLSAFYYQAFVSEAAL